MRLGQLNKSVTVNVIRPTRYPYLFVLCACRFFQCRDSLGDKRDQSGYLFFMHTGPVFLTLVTIELTQLFLSVHLVVFFFSLRVGFSSSTWTGCKKKKKKKKMLLLLQYGSHVHESNDSAAFKKESDRESDKNNAEHQSMKLVVCLNGCRCCESLGNQFDY